MLQSFNQTWKKWVLIPLFGLLILSFVVWGIADVFTPQNMKQETVLQAGSVKLDGQHVQAEVQKNLDFIRRLTGQPITVEQAQQFGLIDRALESLVSRALLEQEAARLGLVISDEVIMSAIRRIPEFQNKDGTFNAEAFKNALRRVNASEALFINDQRIALARDQVKDVVTAGAYTPRLMAQALAAAQAETRDFETFQVKFAQQPLPTAPDDAVLQKYIEDHAAAFSTPEYRAVSFIRLTPEGIARTLTITDAELKTYYDDHADEFSIPERRSLQQVVANSKEEAEKVVAAFASSKDFPAAARAAGLTPTPLPDISRQELPDELQNAAFSLAQGEISPPIESPLGWHVLLVFKITPGTVQDFDKAKAAIKANLLLQQAQERLYEESARLDDLIAGGAALEEIASQLGLTVEKIGSVDAGGMDAKGNAVPVLNEAPALLKAAFQTATGSTGDVLTNGENGYAVLRVDGVTPSAQRPFAEARADALKAWQQEAREKSARETAIKLIADLRGGMLFDKAASAYGVESSRENNVGKKEGALISYIPETYSRDLFALKAGDVAQFPTESGIVVVRFVKANHPHSVADTKPDASLQSSAAEEVKNEMGDAYVEGLKDRYTVVIDRPAINKLFEADEIEE